MSDREKDRRERDLDEELRAHLEAEAEERRAAGLSAEEAVYAARRDLGSLASVKEATREAWGWVWVETLLQDVHYGFRTMRRSPGFTAAAVLSLALGIGANTAVFSLIDAVLLKFLPVQSPEELVIFAHRGTAPASTGSNYPIYESIRDRSRSFSGLLAFFTIDFKVKNGDRVETTAGQFVTTNYFAVLGVKPVIGRAFTEGNEGEPVVILSHAYWKRRFGGTAEVLGKSLVVNGVPLTIVGVAPPEFFGMRTGEASDITIPFQLQPRVSPEYGSRLTLRDGWWSMCIVGRLRQGIDVEQARSEVEVIVRPWIEEVVTRESIKRSTFARIELLPGGAGLDTLRRQFSKPLRVLMGIVAVVLLIGCANVANLLLARAASRRKEIAIRVAIGAGRGRLIRQMLTESMLLAVSGGAAGLLLAVWGARALVAYVSTGPQPVLLDTQPDARVLAFTASVSLLTGFLFGLIPAFKGSRVELKSGGRTRAWSPRKALVAFQVALSLMLLIVAGLFVHSLYKIKTIDPGFRAGNLLLVTFDPGGTGYQREQLAAFYQRVLERASSIPGVRSASLSNLGPLSTENQTRFISVPGFTTRGPEDSVVEVNSVSPLYFDTMGIPLRQGRAFSGRDTAASARVGIISESMARFYFGEKSPLGQAVRMGSGGSEPPIEIVGVAGDSKQHNLKDPAPRMIYVPLNQNQQHYQTLEVRTIGNPGSISAALREEVRRVNSDIPIREIKTVQKQVDSLLIQERLVATLSAFFGSLALLLAAIGLYGVVSYAVVSRTSEIGIRMALGAKPGHVLWSVVRDAAWLVLMGVAAGLLVALAATRLISGMLFGLTATDPVSLSVATLLLLAVAAIAAFIPARRASRIDPLVALRYE